ncbi:Phosphatidylinositol transfer protein [Histomonas meleagridis]|uniref:Phosphatidylinositol transfer protein n=1 Tax=Histomonas meleagridis TaxID=135588 RepID=UPI0035595F2C|nr:Phosphatidylinositol transfer protein [Histomonas meleagridis]KAH0796503.1 Phosphatidylinositol transfer protein [Histomonas meleagridis]
MKIIEFRIILPTNVTQYQIGNLYMCAQRTREESGGGEGIEILKNEPYSDWNGESGQFTHKVLHFKSRIPAFIRWAIPDKYLHVHETSHNGYPHFHTEYHIPGQDDWFYMLVESQHIPYSRDTPIPDNIMNLKPEELAMRKVCYLDIVNSNPKPQKKEWDMHNFVCPEAEITTPLSTPKNTRDETKPPEWTETYPGTMMVCVKIVKIMFKWKGLQTAVEKLATDSVFHDVFLDSHRAMMRWADKWFPMNMEQIRAMEQELQDEQKTQKFDQE